MAATSPSMTAPPEPLNRSPNPTTTPNPNPTLALAPTRYDGSGSKSVYGPRFDDENFELKRSRWSQK